MRMHTRHALQKADVEADPGNGKWRGEKTNVVSRAQVLRGTALTHPTRRSCRRSGRRAGRLGCATPGGTARSTNVERWAKARIEGV